MTTLGVVGVVGSMSDGVVGPVPFARSAKNGLIVTEGEMDRMSDGPMPAHVAHWGVCQGFAQDSHRSDQGKRIAV